MNLNFFSLGQTPFGDADPLSLFWTAKRQDLATLFRRALVERQGMLVLTGEEGSGKTTFVRAVFDGLAGQKLKVISVSSEKSSFPTLLKMVIRELGKTVEQQNPLPNVSTTAEKPAHPTAPFEEIAPLMRALHEALLINHTQQGGKVVLIIDNAHHLPGKVIQDFHWLSMLETPEGKLLQTIFVGNATLSLKLEMPQLRLLKRRIVVHGELTSLSFEESFVYLLTRLRAKHESRSTSPIFSVEALCLLARHGKGNPRFLNTLANAALQMGVTRRQRPISGPLILEVIDEFRTLPMTNRPGARIQRTCPPILSRRTASLSNTRQLWAAGVGAVAATLVLFSYQHGITNGWSTILPNLTRLLFRNNMVAQAAPGTKAIPVSFSLVEDRPPTLEIIPPARITKRDSSDKKRRNLAKVRGKADNRSTARAGSPKLKDNGLEKAQYRSPAGTPLHDLNGDASVPDLPFPGKILYRIPLDPSSNKDRLFDE